MKEKHRFTGILAQEDWPTRDGLLRQYEEDSRYFIKEEVRYDEWGYRSLARVVYDENDVEVYVAY